MNSRACTGLCIKTDQCKKRGCGANNICSLTAAQGKNLVLEICDISLRNGGQKRLFLVLLSMQAHATRRRFDSSVEGGGAHSVVRRLAWSVVGAGHGPAPSPRLGRLVGRQLHQQQPRARPPVA